MVKSPDSARREFLRISGLTILGVLTPRLRWLAAAKPPWEGLPGTPITEHSAWKLDAAVVLGTGNRNEEPALAVTPDRVWVTWVHTDAEGEHLFVAAFPAVGDIARAPLFCSEVARGLVHRPAIATAGNSAYVAWAEMTPPSADSRADGSRPRARVRWVRVEPEGRAGEPLGGPLASWCGSPQLTLDGHGNGWLVWEARDGHLFGIWGLEIRRGQPAGSPFPVCCPSDADARRPAVGRLADGSAWVVWDRSRPHGSSHIEARRLRPNRQPGPIVALTQGSGLHLAPAIACDASDRAWVAWSTNCWPDATLDVVRRVELARLDPDGHLRWPPQPPPVERETRSTIQGFEFPYLACSADGLLWLSGRASQCFYLTVFDGRGWQELVRLPKDGWGGRGQHVALAPTPRRGELFTVRRDLDDALLQRFVTTVAPAPARPASSHPPRRAVADSDARLRDHLEFEPWGQWQYYFGDLHGHTAASDGTGDADEYFMIRRDLYALDFAALTDHDSFVGNTLSPSEWEFIKTVTDHFDSPGRFVTLFGQEWTTPRVPRGAGHMNVYTTRRDVPLFDHTLPAYDTASKLIAAARAYGALVVPHHIGWTGTAWEAFAPDVVRLVEIVSVHGAHEFMGNRPIPHRGGMKGHFVQDGLARGLRFGLVGGTDSHGLLWQHGQAWLRDPYRCGLTAVLAPRLTREDIFAALLQRRCYATSGTRMRIVFEANGAPMGSEITSTEAVRLRIDVSSESPLRWLEIVKNNATVFTFGGEGHRSAFTWEDPDRLAPGATAYYYLRVTCRDDHMAWTSPIWVTQPEQRT